MTSKKELWAQRRPDMLLKRIQKLKKNGVRTYSKKRIHRLRAEIRRKKHRGKR